MRSLPKITFLFAMAFFVVVGIKGICVLRANTGGCILWVERTASGWDPYCKGECDDPGYKCDDVQMQVGNNMAYWCICKNDETGDSQNPDTDCDGAIQISDNGNGDIIDNLIECDVDECEYPCYKLVPDSLEVGDKAKICICGSS